MKTKSYFAIVASATLFLIVNCIAEEAKTNTHPDHPSNSRTEYEKYISTAHTKDGFTLGINSMQPGIGTNTTELPMDLLFKAATNTRSMFFVPKAEYLARIELYDSNDQPIAKTKLGSQYGLYFDNIYWDVKKFAIQPHGPRTVGNDWITGASLPKVSDIFAIKKPGQYRLKLEIQVMLLYLNMKKGQTRKIVRFPTIEIVMTRPESLKENP